MTDSYNPKFTDYEKRILEDSGFEISELADHYASIEYEENESLSVNKVLIFDTGSYIYHLTYRDERDMENVVYKELTFDNFKDLMEYASE